MAVTDNERVFDPSFVSEVSMGLGGYRDLFVWRESMALVPDIYAVTNAFPKRKASMAVAEGDEDPRAPEPTDPLALSMKQAVVAVPVHIAVGETAGDPGAFVTRLNLALGRLAELLTLLAMAEQVGLIGPALLAEMEEKVAAIAPPIRNLVAVLETRAAGQAVVA